MKVINFGNIRESIEKYEPVYYEYYAKSEADKVIAEKDKEIEELKQKLESVDAGMRERRLRRALWSAREWRAWCEGQFWFSLESDKPRDIYHLICTNRIHRTPNEWVTYWQKVEQLCEKKKEEYK